MISDLPPESYDHTECILPVVQHILRSCPHVQGDGSRRMFMSILCTTALTNGTLGPQMS